jgi:magnesium transporter
MKTDFDEPVSAHLRRDFPLVLVAQTAAQALESIRSNPPSGRVIYLYAIDPDQRLCGVVPIRRLLLAGPDTPLSQLLSTRVVAIPDSATVLDACEFFVQYRFLAFPVVDSTRKVLGVIDVDLFADELLDLGSVTERADIFQKIGVHLERVKGTVRAGFRDRFPWLCCNLGAGILAAVLCGLFQKELNQVVALAFFIPVVLNLAESVSSQSVSLALHSLHDTRPTWKTLLAGIRGEAKTGALLGLGAGAIVALVSLAWLQHLKLATCLIAAITAGVAASAAFGLSMPFILRLIKLEPRVAAGPVSLAAADIMTITVYFTLARWLLP